MGDAFSLQLHPLELVLRGSAMYWFLFLLFRFVLRRDAGSVGLADILLLVVVADASQNAMAGSYTSVPDGIVLVSTIAAWNWLLDWGGYRSRWIRRLAEPPPLVLVRHGRLMRRNLRREFITVPELMASLREHGIEKLADVKIARMEPDGQISVIHAGRRGAAADDDDEAPRRRTPGA
ncbi:DUF421 domain-containing protein [Piscinibacter sp.]|uniref:DUF421 domain-containing protein n=1 Tax=Piscinibacter sp. TaxID=1903157 RepID=UPI0039E2D264